ncbi:MAG TPA: V-type ATPase 116kDa subunit family protein, partial [Candidatus Aquilonibacter sp.]|nr:V-type ATPase 116kDa subunit family protein [Candidatus Aquilonibacter sp.]
MLSTEPMQKVRMLFLDQERDGVVAFLHKQGILDLRRSKLELGEVQSTVATEISNSLIRVNGVLQLLKPAEIHQAQNIGLETLISKVKNASYIDSIYTLGEKRREMSEDFANLEYGERIANAFSGVEIDFSRLQSNALSFKAFITDAKSAEKVSDALKRTKIRSNLISKKIDKKSSLVFVAYDKAHSLEDVTKGLKVEEIDLKSKYLIGTPQHAISNITKIREAYSHSIKEIEKELGQMSHKHYSELSAFKEMLEIEAQRAGASTTFKRTEKVFVVEGWVPAKSYEGFVSAVKKFTKNKFEIEKLYDKELAPTLVNRPAFLKPFDFLMEFYSVPRSDEIDPTWIFIITFPIFYGLMISDVGYGVLSFLLGWFIAKRTKPDDLLHNVAKVWQLCAISAVIFGFLSNQYFGFELNQNFTSFVGFNWVTNATSILVFTIVFGLIQVILGFAFSFYNQWKHGHVKHAMSKLSSIITILVGTAAVYGFFTGASYTGIFGIVTALFVVITAVISGIEASEITNLMTHPLSYARILGFGMASVIIARLIDNAFTPSFNGGILGFI